MTMKTSSETKISRISLLLVVLVMVACARKEQESTASDQYTCPMHPTVLSPTQGACPVCGMDLVRKAKAGEELKITEDIARLLQSPDQSIVADLKTVKGVFRRMPLVVTAEGRVAYDTRYAYTIAARMAGRLDHVSIRYLHQEIKRGQKIAEIYSPEMLVAQQELLFLAKQDSGNQLLISAARKKLGLLGATPAQIDSWLRKGEADPVFVIYSPYDGFVMVQEEMTDQVSKPKEDTGVGRGSEELKSTPTPSSSSLVREGDYVTRGQTIFTLLSHEALRVELSVPVRQATAIKIGDPVVVTTDSGSGLDARVDFTQPFISAGEEFITIRVYVIDNGLRVGQWVKASLTKESAEALWLPADAVVDLGTQSIVFSKDRGVFKPRVVTCEARSGEWISIVRGLSSSEEVAARAAYLVDSESFIKTSLTK